MADTASVNSPDIDRVWSPALQYVVIIPQKADREIYPILKRILNDPVYTMQNTLILYPSQLENSIRKVNTAYQLLLFPMELFDSDPKQIVAASIEDIKSSRSTYHYKIVKQKIYK